MRREQARRRERARKTRGRRAVLHLPALPSTPRNAPPWTHAPWNEGWRALPRDRRARSRGMVDRRTPPGLPGSSVCSRGGGARPHPNQPSCAQTAPQRSPPHVYGVVASLPRRGGGTETPRRLHGGSRAIPSALHMPQNTTQTTAHAPIPYRRAGGGQAPAMARPAAFSGGARPSHFVTGACLLTVLALPCGRLWAGGCRANSSRRGLRCCLCWRWGVFGVARVCVCPAGAALCRRVFRVFCCVALFGCLV